MTTINLATSDQLLMVVQQPTISSGEQNSVKLQVDFDSMWDDCARSAVFFTEKRKNEIYEVVLTDDECTVPHEVLVEESNLFIGVRGVNSTDKKVKTSSLVRCRILEGAPAGTENTTEPTPSLYQQLLTNNNMLQARVNNLARLEEGSTTGDAELIDIRIDIDGIKHASAGEAVRHQIRNLKMIQDWTIEALEIINDDALYSKTTEYKGEAKTFERGSDYFVGDTFTFRFLAADKDLIEIVYTTMSGLELVPTWVESGNEYEEITYTVTDDSYSIKVNSYVDVIAKTKTGKVQDLKDEVDKRISEGGGSITVDDVISVFEGKKASFYGDSLTELNSHYTKGYHAWVKELLGLSSYDNYGVSGYTTESVYNRVKSNNDTSDIIFVMCGVNDQTFSVPLGTFADISTGTTYGNLNLLCAKLKEKYPMKLIVFITPHYQTKYPHNNGVTSYEISKAIKEVCEKYSIVVYDNFIVSGICSTNLSYWTTDNCHWNDKAHEMLGRNLSKFVLDTFRYYFGYVEEKNPDNGETEVTLSGISATYTGGSVHVGMPVSSLTGITVIATYSDGSNSSVTGYTLSGTIVEGSNTITVSYGGKTTTFTVIGVAESGGEEPEITLSSIEATFTQGSNVIYENETLETLKQYLTVNAVYSDGSNKVVSDYTLSGSLIVGNSTITVNYGGKSTNFIVIVSDGMRILTIDDIIAKDVDELAVSEDGDVTFKVGSGSFPMIEIDSNITEIKWEKSNPKWEHCWFSVKKTPTSNSNEYKYIGLSAIEKQIYEFKHTVDTTTSKPTLLTDASDYSYGSCRRIVFEKGVKATFYDETNNVIDIVEGSDVNCIAFFISHTSTFSPLLENTRVK